MSVNDNLGTPDQYGDVVAVLLDATKVPELGPGKPNFAARPVLDGLAPEDLFPAVTVVDHDMAACCLSGLWLWNDFLDASHTISQDIHTTSGSYWHGIMHRREGDFSNAKYWFRKVGQHPIFADLARVAAKRIDTLGDPTSVVGLVRGDDWDPYVFIDLCQQCRGSDSPLMTFCQTVARDEWRLLFDYCYRCATRALG